MWEDNILNTLLIMDSLLWNLMTDLFLKNMQLFVSQDGSGVVHLCFIVMFYQLFGLSFWRHPFTAEDPLFGSIQTN